MINQASGALVLEAQRLYTAGIVNLIGLMNPQVTGAHRLEA